MHDVRESERRNRFGITRMTGLGISKSCSPLEPRIRVQGRDLHSDISVGIFGLYVVVGSVGTNEITQRRE